MIEFGKIYTSGEILEHSKELAKEHPGHLHYRRAGESHDGREIPGLLLGDSGKCLIVSSAIHGRESLNPALLLRMAEDYALIRENEYRDPGLDEWQELLTDYSIYFLPLMNPDGYEIALRGFSEIRNPLFGNIAAAKGILHTEWKENGRGVDINRNFPCASYQAREGMKKSASEQETRALIHAFGEFPESVGYIDFHSRGRIIYYYRDAMPYRYNRRAKCIAKHLQKISGYALGKRKEEHASRNDGGNSVNFYAETYRKPALTVETVGDEEEFPLNPALQAETYQETRWIPLEFLKNLLE